MFFVLTMGSPLIHQDFDVSSSIVFNFLPPFLSASLAVTSISRRSVQKLIEEEKFMKFRTIMRAACAALAVLSIEPVTGLLKISVALAGMAVGAVLADPVSEEAAEVKKQFQAMRKQMYQKPVEATAVD
jgi:hypothetical protein